MPEQLNIIFYKDSEYEEQLESFQAPSIPFKVGDVISIEVTNKDLKHWSVKPFNKNFKVVSMLTHFQKDYAHRAFEYIHVLVHVEEVKE